MVKRHTDELASQAQPPPEEVHTIMQETRLDFGPYEVIEKIGMGGMGVVYKAIDTRLERLVAIKCLSPHLNTDDGVRQRFMTEARAVSQLDHPNICVIYDIGETAEKQLYFTMPFYEGETLARKIKRGSLLAEAIIPIVIQIAKGLMAAHNKAILHRDIKPANILLPMTGGLKILDFGVAKISDVENTSIGEVLGTVAYMSPEQLKGEVVDTRADIWSLGILLFEMFAGRRPFKGKQTHEMMYSILNDELADLTSIINDAPDLLNHIVQRSLSRDIRARYTSIADMLGDLEALQARWHDVGTVVLKQGLGATDSGQSESAVSQWDKSKLNTLSRELTKHLGPMASIIVKQQARETNSMKVLCQKLSENLPNDEMRKQFLNATRFHAAAEDDKPSGISSVSHEGGFSEETLEELAGELTFFIGPIAGKLVKRVSKSSPDLKTLYEKLADYLEESEKEKFLMKKRTADS
ncbi:MAG TPA: serine/threonine protein kinase [Gammaproteobacteria bacterium]|nr:serine/threonine protein kinase [Gammaproteobacteria bacterium]